MTLFINILFQLAALLMVLGFIGYYARPTEEKGSDDRANQGR